MGISISSATGGGTNVTKQNLSDVIYIKGDEFTDGSIRLILGSDDETQIQKRVNGVWNLGEFELSSDTLLLGHNLSLSAIGTNLQINAIEGNKQFLALDVPFDDSGSSFPRSPVLGKRSNRLLLQSIFSNENVAQQIQISITITSLQGFNYILYLKTGSIAATAPIEITITEGLIPGGFNFFDRLYGITDFPANTEIQLNLGAGLGFFTGEEILLTLSSDENFSLLGNSSGDIFFGFDFQPCIQEHLLMDIMTLSREADLTLDREGNFVVGRTF